MIILVLNPNQKSNIHMIILCTYTFRSFSAFSACSFDGFMMCRSLPLSTPSVLYEGCKSSVVPRESSGSTDRSYVHESCMASREHWPASVASQSWDLLVTSWLPSDDGISCLFLDDMIQATWYKTLEVWTSKRLYGGTYILGKNYPNVSCQGSWPSWEKLRLKFGAWICIESPTERISNFSTVQLRSEYV